MQCCSTGKNEPSREPAHPPRGASILARQRCCLAPAAARCGLVTGSPLQEPRVAGCTSRSAEEPGAVALVRGVHMLAWSYARKVFSFVALGIVMKCVTCRMILAFSQYVPSAPLVVRRRPSRFHVWPGIFRSHGLPPTTNQFIYKGSCKSTGLFMNGHA